MSERCLTEIELAGLMDLPPGHPRRAHLDACPRCRARLAQYVAFLAAPAGVPAEEAHDADRRLGEFLEREIAGGAQRPRGERVSFVEWLVGWWRSPAAAPALAVAAVVAAAGGVALVWTLRTTAPERPAGSEEPLLRGGESAVVALATPVVTPGAGAHLAWAAVPGADGYLVLLYSPALDEVGRLGPSSDTTLEIPREKLVTLAAGDTLLVRVRALRAGASLGESRLEPLVAK